MIILTFCLEDCKNPEIKLESDKLIFKGVGGPDLKQHELTIDFFKEVDTEVRIFDYFLHFTLEALSLCLLLMIKVVSQSRCSNIIFIKLIFKGTGCIILNWSKLNGSEG